MSQGAHSKLRSIECKRLVIKIGSSILTQPLDSSSESTCVQVERINALCTQIATLKASISEIVIVSSGAVASGFSLLGFLQRPKDIIDKQACAAVGQARLLWQYEQAFSKHSLHIAQMLLTKDDLSNPKRYLYASAALRRLLELGTIPIINENDPVLVDELKYIETFGDNDNLAALVAGMIDADLLLILSDVDGLYSANPATNPNAKRISEVLEISEQITNLAEQDTNSAVGTGGMASKLKAAKKAMQTGCNVAIIKGANAENIAKFFNGEDVGTYFHLPANAIKKRKFYISYVAIPKGKLYIDYGAQKAIKDGKSLLPKGVLEVQGSFEAGDAVSIYTPQHQEIARGKARYSGYECAQIIGRDSKDIAKILGQSYGDCLIHCDDMAILE